MNEVPCCRSFRSRLGAEGARDHLSVCKYDENDENVIKGISKIILVDKVSSYPRCSAEQR